MNVISLEELYGKIAAGENIEEIAKGYSVCFYPGERFIPEYISVETLIEIIDKAPELFTTTKHIPGWVLLLLLLREKFDIVDSIVEGLYKGEKFILQSYKTTNGSDIARKTVKTIKQVTKEQISELLSLMEKRSNLLSGSSMDHLTRFIISQIFEPCEDFLNEEHFVVFLEWADKGTNPYFFKYVSSSMLDKFPINNQLVQKKLAEYFIFASASGMFKLSYNSNGIFRNWDKMKLLDEEFFVSYVVKFFPGLYISKKVYLLNFSYFLENYPQLAVKSLKEFVKNIRWGINLIIKDKRIFIPNKIWDILVKKEPLLFIKLIRNLPGNRFYFDIDYVSDKAKLACFINPEDSKELNDRLKMLKGMFTEKEAYKIIGEIRQEASAVSSLKSPQHAKKVLNFVLDNKLPYDIICWVSRLIFPSDPHFSILGAEDLEYKFGTVKPQLLEFLSYLKEINKEIEK